jgi:hypothetical protein
MRLSQKNQYCRENFLAGTGTVPYGYNLVVEYDRESRCHVRKVVPNQYQMRIIAFIQSAREIGASLDVFNRLLEGLVEEFSYYREEKLRDQPFVPYQFYNEWDEPLVEIENPLSYRDIAKILNENGILYTNKRVKKWTSELVSKLAKFVPYNERSSKPKYVDLETLINTEMNALLLNEPVAQEPAAQEPDPDEPEPAAQEPAAQEPAAQEPAAQSKPNRKRKCDDITMTGHSYGLRSLKRNNRQE